MCGSCSDFTTVPKVIRLNLDFFRQCSHFCFLFYLFFIVFCFVLSMLFLRLLTFESSLYKNVIKIILSAFHTFILTTCCNCHIYVNFQDNYISILFTTFHNLKCNGIHTECWLFFLMYCRYYILSYIMSYL